MVGNAERRDRGGKGKQSFREQGKARSREKGRKPVVKSEVSRKNMKISATKWEKEG